MKFEEKNNKMFVDNKEVVFKETADFLNLKKTFELNGKTYEISKVLQKGRSFEDLEIPAGWDIPTLQLGIDFVNDEEIVKWIDFESQEDDFYVKQPFKKNEGKRCAWLVCYDSGFNLNSDGNLNFDIATRGVLLYREVKT